MPAAPPGVSLRIDSFAASAARARGNARSGKRRVGLDVGHAQLPAGHMRRPRLEVRLDDEADEVATALGDHRRTPVLNIEISSSRDRSALGEHPIGPTRYTGRLRRVGGVGACSSVDARKICSPSGGPLVPRRRAQEAGVEACERVEMGGRRCAG